jgi:D-3-phosphoglycerate dehydrogenase
MTKILATPRSFANRSPEPLELLERAGFTVIKNPVGRILTEAEMIQYLADCEGVIVGVDPLGREVMEKAPKLRAIAKYGVGTDNIDVSYAKERGIPVTVTAGANSEAVADWTFSLMLALARDLITIDRKCRERDWKKITGTDVYGKTLGIIGLGAIGKGVARRASGFNMRVLAQEPYWDDDFAKKWGIQQATVHEICRESDFITLHVPLCENTRSIIGKNELELMKKDAVLINTSRGGIVDEDALLDALSERRIRGAGIDAFSKEPPEDPRWYSQGNIIIGNHAGAATYGAADMMSLMAAKNLINSLSGNPR